VLDIDIKRRRSLAHVNALESSLDADDDGCRS
jgi:hypothetical protein